MIFYEPGRHKEHGFRHDPFKAFVSPRPIGWISTVDIEGRTNLAPYSFFNAMSFLPPVVVFGSGTKADGSPKDSQRNVEATGEFVCNIVSEALKEQMNKTSAHLPHGEDEMSFAALEGAPSQRVKPLRVAAAPVALECRYLQSVKLPSWNEPAGNYAIFGEVIGIHVDPAIVEDGLVDVTRYRPVARLGYFDYATVSEVYQMFRPD